MGITIQLWYSPPSGWDDNFEEYSTEKRQMYFSYIEDKVKNILSDIHDLKEIVVSAGGDKGDDVTDFQIRLEKLDPRIRIYW